MSNQKLNLDLELKAVDTEQRIIEGYAAAFGNRDLNGDIIDRKAFDRTLKERRDVPVFVGHDVHSLPVGEPLEMAADERGLRTKTLVYRTSEGDALLEVAKRRLASGKTLGMSIGYRAVKAVPDSKDSSIRRLEDVDLFEYSFLASPSLAANPEAVVLSVKEKGKDGEDGESKMAMPAHGSPTDTESAWDGPAAVAAAPNEARVLRYMHAYMDPDGDPDAKQTYKFPHHMPRMGSPAVIAGVNNALARLPQANIPASDRAAVEAHLRRHRRDAGLEEAGADLQLETAALALSELGQFLAGEHAAMARLEMDTKQGRVLRSQLREKLRSVVEGLQAVLAETEPGEAEGKSYRAYELELLDLDVAVAAAKARR